MSNPNFTPSMSTNEIYRDINTAQCLTDDLDAIESSLANKASRNHEHSAYADVNHSHVGYADVDHTHTGYASDNHAHDEYAEVNHSHTGYASESHTHNDYAEVNHSHTGYASESHTHDEYAEVNHSHTGYASESHTHDYASVNHTHSEYADVDHGHTEYFSKTGGSITGDTNIEAILRVNGQQAVYYNTTSNSQSFGTNNATGGTTICCGPSATVGVNGAITKTPMVLPRATNTFTLGNANFRWSGIYSTTAVNVSSDERVKRDIKALDRKELMNFVNSLNVVEYNYKDDAEDSNPRIGLIAQDVLKADARIADYFVSEDEEGMLGLKPSDLVFPLIASVQQLTAKIQELEDKLSSDN